MAEQLQFLAAEFAITVFDGAVWLGIGQGLLFGGVCLLFGIWVARTVGLLDRDAPAGEVLGVGLASGLLVLAAWWAAIWSGGRSSFTPVAVGFAISVAIAIARRTRRRGEGDMSLPEVPIGGGAETAATRPGRRSLVVAALAGGVFAIAIALLYGSTVAPSPRNGVQPLEFNDIAFYSVLGRDLAATGTETTLTATGFSELEGVPVQTWYHWGEIWLASAMVTIFGTAPMAARYFVVLPVVLLAAAALGGTLVRRVSATESLQAYVFGFLAILFLAPVPLIPGPFFSSWAGAGMISSISLYGLSAVAVLLALYSVAVIGRRQPSWALASFIGSGVALILPAHIATAVLSTIGVCGVCAIRIGQSVMSVRRLPPMSPAWQRIVASAGVASLATVIWGLWTGHIGGSGGTVLVAPFGASWRDSVAITMLGGGAFFAIPAAMSLIRRKTPLQADLYVGTLVLLVAGAVAWGARLGEFTMFYLFFAGIAVIATPVAAIAIRVLWERLRAAHHLRLALVLVVVCVIQLEWGIWNSTLRLQTFGPKPGETVPVSLLDAIRRLPPGAKLAYNCGPLEESAFGDPQLISIDAHSAHRVVPMCFSAELLSILIGASPSLQVPNLYFTSAPQRALYPDAAAKPSLAVVIAFMKEHGIGFIYADAQHPNTLVSDAVPIMTSGDTQILRVP